MLNISKIVPFISPEDVMCLSLGPEGPFVTFGQYILFLWLVLGSREFEGSKENF